MEWKKKELYSNYVVKSIQRGGNNALLMVATIANTPTMFDTYIGNKKSSDLISMAQHSIQALFLYHPAFTFTIT